MSAWLVPLILATAGLVWLELRRPERSHLAARVVAVLGAVAALVILLSLRPDRGPITLLTPGVSLADRSHGAVSLDQAQSLAALARSHRPVRLAGWGLLSHEWPDPVPRIAGFEPSPLPTGIVRLDAPAEVGVGERLLVRGSVVLERGARGEVVLEDPAGPRDSARVTADSADFELSDRPRAPGAVAYRLRFRTPGRPEQAETLALAVRQVPMPAILMLDGSPSFETGALKRWLAERGTPITVRTTISRDRYRTEGVNGSPNEVGRLTPALLGRFDAILADGASLAALGSAERSALDRQVRERGLGLLVTADVPWLLSRGACDLVRGFGLEPIAVAALGPRDRGERRVTRPVLPQAPRQSRTGIDAEASSLKPTAEGIVGDELGRLVAGWRRAGAGRVGVTLLRTPSRWLLEGEPELYAAYWYAMLRAITRDTTTRITIGGDGPLRERHPVAITLHLTEPPTAANGPVAAVIAPDGHRDTLALGQDPFDPARLVGRYWPRSAGWHRLALRGGRTVPFRVTHPAEWVGVEANARLAASLPRVAGATHPVAAEDRVPRLGPMAFAALVLALTFLWVEGRRAR